MPVNKDEKPVASFKPGCAKVLPVILAWIADPATPKRA
jgi:hypothetical protein